MNKLNFQTNQYYCPIKEKTIASMFNKYPILKDFFQKNNSFQYWFHNCYLSQP
jgi:hypothetical protein